MNPVQSAFLFVWNTIKFLILNSCAVPFHLVIEPDWSLPPTVDSATISPVVSLSNAESPITMAKRNKMKRWRCWGVSSRNREGKLLLKETAQLLQVISGQLRTRLITPPTVDSATIAPVVPFSKEDSQIKIAKRNKMKFRWRCWGVSYRSLEERLPYTLNKIYWIGKMLEDFQLLHHF